MGRPWFRRRGAGVGWRPVSWQGWTITLAAVVLVVGVLVLLRSSPGRIPLAVLVLAVYAIVARLTGGSPPDVTTPSIADSDPAAEARVEGKRSHDSERESPESAAQQPGPATSPGPPALVVEHLTKRFGERTAVGDVSFTVAAGEVFGFLGPNGAGKTTTVRMLGTLLAPTFGSAVVAGVPLDPAHGIEIRERIAVMPENPGLYLRLTVAENLELFAGLYRLDRPNERIVRALTTVNLAGRANDLCGSLSKGLRQRVALARTLLSDPAILFLDEPTSGLDPVASRDVHELIDDLRDRRVTVFLTTHRLEEAERLCDRVAILNTSLRTIGRPDELRDRLFTKALVIRTAAPLASPEQVFAVGGVENWRSDGDAGYVLTVSDPDTVAPVVTRALVASGADVLSLAEARHSLEDVYLELVDDDVEAAR
jgi:ABC-2 type transport system ATP-binding protein